eukprot:Pgem_evm1s6579
MINVDPVSSRASTPYAKPVPSFLKPLVQPSIDGIKKYMDSFLLKSTDYRKTWSSLLQ